MTIIQALAYHATFTHIDKTPEQEELLRQANKLLRTVAEDCDKPYRGPEMDFLG